jgi:dihydroflavonol-4-reductase
VLVIGASGFLGSHVTRQLVERGDDVRILIRATSSTRAIGRLAVERCDGDIFDDDALWVRHG